MKRFCLLLIISIFLFSCVTASINLPADFLITLKNNTDKLCYYYIYWIDHDWTEGGYSLSIPANVAGGELRANGNYTLSNPRRPGHYRIIWRDNENRESEPIEFYGKGGDEVFLEYNGYISSSVKAPFTLHELGMWSVVEFVGQGTLTDYPNDPHDGTAVYAFLAANPDQESKWVGMYGFLDQETGVLLRVMLFNSDEGKYYIYSVIDDELNFLEAVNPEAEPEDKGQSI